MEKPLRLQFRWGDCIAIALVVLLAAGVFVLCLPGGSEEATVQIYRDGALLGEYPLEENREFTVKDGYINTIRIRDGQVRIVSSTCPGEDCVHSGPIKDPGRSLVCLPNRVEVRIVGRASDVDFVVR